MNITHTFDENGKTLQEIMEHFLIVFYTESLKK